MGTIRTGVFLLIIINLLFIGYLIFYNDSPTLTTQVVKVDDIIDGDTLRTDIGDIRLQGINTPEKGEEYYEEAKDFLEIYRARELDFLHTDNDKYNRKLGYLFFQNQMINELILLNGFAHTYYYSEDSFTQRLLDAEQIAIKNEAGIWKRSTILCSSCIELVDLETGQVADDCSSGKEFIKLENTCGSSCNLDGWTVKDDATHIYTFKGLVLRERDTLTLFNGEGKDLGNVLYWGNKGCARIWNDDHDTFFLRDSEGKLIIYYRYGSE